MKTKNWLVIAACIASLGTSSAGAQEAPVPMPRPADRMPSSADSPPATPADAAAEATAAIEAATAEEQPVSLTARITENGMTISEGLTWRVFDTRLNNAGNLALAVKSEEPAPRIALAPGEYVVHVSYGRAQASDTLQVVEGDNSKAMVLDAGALRLNAAITGDVPIPINLLRFDVFSDGEEGAQTLEVQNLSANDIVTLNAGTYHVVSYFGSVNAVVRADLRVEPGQLTDATLYHRSAQISFKLVTEAGGEAIADVEWTVKAEDGTTIYTNIGAFPATVLSEGEYLVLAKRGDTVYNREFEVQPGRPREVEVLTTVY
ncbi:MAG TPA: hypothetical protein VGN80_01855 [Devosiaceae bacterium]|nr:hypothetical protein [Devosiaceae bacterium]